MFLAWEPHPPGLSCEEPISNNYAHSAMPLKGNKRELLNSYVVGFLIFNPYARYGSFKGCGILVHAELGFWGARQTTFGKQFLASLSLVGPVFFLPQRFNAS